MTAGWEEYVFKVRFSFCEIFFWSTVNRKYVLQKCQGCDKLVKKTPHYATMNSSFDFSIGCAKMALNHLGPLAELAYLLRQNYKISEDYLCWIVKGVSFHTEVHISDKYKSRSPWTSWHEEETTSVIFSKQTNIHSISWIIKLSYIFLARS